MSAVISTVALGRIVLVVLVLVAWQVIRILTEILSLPRTISQEVTDRRRDLLPLGSNSPPAPGDEAPPVFSLTSYQDTRLTAESEIFQSQPGDDLWRTWRLTNSCQRSLGGETAQHQLQLPNLAWLAEMDLVNLRLAGPAVLRLSPSLPEDPPVPASQVSTVTVTSPTL